MKWLNFNPKNCMDCLVCMTIKEEQVKGVNCETLINMIRRGGPKFGYEECASSDCTKCVDICSGKALYKK